jgi:hypothetical protein
LRVSENNMLRRIHGPKADEVAGKWRKFNNRELINLYSSPDLIRVIKSRVMRWAEHVPHMRAIRNMYRNVIRKPKRRMPLRRPRHRWEHNATRLERCTFWSTLKF